MSRQYGEPSLDLSAFEHDFELRDAASVLEFIEAEPSLVGTLLEAREQMRQWFPGAVIFVEIENDPDSRDNHRLLVSIGSPFNAKETLQALDQFDHQWWLKNLDRAKGKVTITVELI